MPKNQPFSSAISVLVLKGEPKVKAKKVFGRDELRRVSIVVLLYCCIVVLLYCCIVACVIAYHLVLLEIKMCIKIINQN
ncbi:hypothetical protein [Helicobacter cetorum]|uniref:hypothetical protein n=1 Tax=Helicobacter cetorum TaxID=138563 RepID=UPI001F2E480D|nr:hypothetical protein [Helicobacter cetorum]